MLKHIFYNKKGFTLIELMAVIPIFLIILALVFSVNNFSNKMFKSSLNKSYNQQDVRVVGDYIAKEVRSAKELSVVATFFENEDANYYALVYLNNHLVKQTIKGTTVTASIVVGGALTNLFFSKTVNAGMLRFSVEDNANGQNYNVNYEILLNNTDADISTAVSRIYYSKY